MSAMIRPAGRQDSPLDRQSPLDAAPSLPEHGLAILSARSLVETCEALVAALSDHGLPQVGIALRSQGRTGFIPENGPSPALATAVAGALGPSGRSGKLPPNALEIFDTLEDARAVLLTLDGRALPPLKPDQCRLVAMATRRLTELATLSSLRSAVESSARAEQLQRALFAIADMAGSDRDMPSLLKGLHDIIGKLMYAENFFIALYSPERDTLRFVYFADHEDSGMYDPEEELPASQMPDSLTLGLIRHGQLVHGTTREVAEILQVPGGLGRGTPAVDFIGVPMVRAGQTVGAIVVQSYRQGERYTDSDCAVLSFVAEHILNALERKQGQQELEWRVEDRTRQLAEANRVLHEQIQVRERAEHLQATLYRIAALTNDEEGTERFYREIHLAVGELLNADNFYIALVADDGAMLDFPYYVDAKIARKQARPFARGMTEYVIRQGTTLLASRDRMQAMIEAGTFESSAAYGELSRCWLGVPLKGPDGVIGVVAVQSYRDEHDYDAGDAELLTFVSYQIANTLQRRAQAGALQKLNAELEQRVHERTHELRQQMAVRAQVEAQLQHQVMHDALTGLPNRVYLRDRLERSIAQQRRHPERQFALMYLDVDRFKLFNDNLGHLAGDEVLRAVAERLQQCVREPDVVARLSGDEFAVLLEECTTPQDACKVAQRIQQRLGAPLQVAGRELQLSASMGIALSEPRHEHIDKLLHDADIALYRAKAAGRQRYVLFDDSLQKTAMDVLEIERQLRSALANQQFEPYFQPIVDLQDGRSVGFEALIRWRHPERGLLAPADFLQVAEDSGMIEDIDWSLYRAACLEARDLVREGGFITLNISPRHFQNEDFDRRLLGLLEQTRFPAAQLRIEVTEGTLLGDPEAVTKILDRLHDAGVGAALDDFGTGYSSLGYVHRFPLRMIKIDRSFVEPLGGADTQRSQAIVEAVIALTGSLDLDVVAEGIETQAQRQALIDMGCTYGQGYLFGRPQSAGHWLAAESAGVAGKVG